MSTPNIGLYQSAMTDTWGTIIPGLSNNASTIDSKIGILSSFIINVKSYNPDATGSTDSSTAFSNANSATTAGKLFVPKGTYLINSSITFNMPVIFDNGAVLKVRNGAVVTFNQGIEAGWYTIFDTLDDFVNSFTANSSVIITGVPVKVDWFASKVSNQSNILNIPDQTNNIMKAFRAAAGNWVANGSNYMTANPNGVLELGEGYYRVDGQINFSKIITNVYYQVNGFHFKGQGMNTSFLMRTDMSATAYVLYVLYTGEMTTIDNFKIVAFNPSGGTTAQKYYSSAACLIFLQGSSLFLSKVWVAGAQVAVVDANSVNRNGVGIQFSSCVDTFFSDIAVEHCITGLAFGSSNVSGVNADIYSTSQQAIGLGVFDSTWANTQTTSSEVHLTNVQAVGSVRGIQTLENGNTGHITIRDSLIDGYSTEQSATVGTNFCNLKGGTSFNGVIDGCTIKNFPNNIFLAPASSNLGQADKTLFVDKCHIETQTNASNCAVFNLNAASTYANIVAVGLNVKAFQGALVLGAASGKISLDKVSLSGYVGQVDNSANRQLFSNAYSGMTLDIRNVYRDNSDTTALNQFGYAAGGNIYLHIDNLYNATRAVSGTATVKMPSEVAFA